MAEGKRVLPGTWFHQHADEPPASRQTTENGDNYTSVKDCGTFLKKIYQIVQGNYSRFLQSS